MKVGNVRTGNIFICGQLYGGYKSGDPVVFRKRYWTVDRQEGDVLWLNEGVSDDGLLRLGKPSEELQRSKK